MINHRVLHGARSVELAGNHNPDAPPKTVRAGPFGGENDRRPAALLCRVFGLRIAREGVLRLLGHAGPRAAPLEPGSEAGPYW